MKKRTYIPPKAELVLLAPCEGLANWDWAFGNTWRSQGFHERDGSIASAIAMNGGFGADGYPTLDTDDGFVIKK